MKLEKLQILKEQVELQQVIKRNHKENAVNMTNNNVAKKKSSTRMKNDKN